MQTEQVASPLPEFAAEGVPHPPPPPAGLAQGCGRRASSPPLPAPGGGSGRSWQPSLALRGRRGEEPEQEGHEGHEGARRPRPRPAPPRPEPGLQPGTPSLRASQPASSGRGLPAPGDPASRPAPR